MALETSDGFSARNGRPNNQVVEHGTLGVAGFDQFFVGQMLVLLSGIGGSHVLRAPLLYDAKSLSDLVMDHGKVGPILGL